jgi:hypothetical protein
MLKHGTNLSALIELYVLLDQPVFGSIRNTLTAGGVGKAYDTTIMILERDVLRGIDMMIRWWIHLKIGEPCARRRVIAIGSSRLWFDVDNHDWLYWQNIKHYNLSPSFPRLPGERRVYCFKAIPPGAEFWP